MDHSQFLKAVLSNVQFNKKPSTGRESIAIPGTANYVKLLMKFAETGIQVREPVLVGDRIESFLDEIPVSSPTSPLLTSILQKKWTNVGNNIEVKFASIIPKFDILTTGINLIWTYAPQIRLAYSLFRWITARVSNFFITPEYGRISLNGFQTPRLLWM